jgi:hypothetical protein
MSKLIKQINFNLNYVKIPMVIMLNYLAIKYPNLG